MKDLNLDPFDNDEYDDDELSGPDYGFDPEDVNSIAIDLDEKYIAEPPSHNEIARLKAKYIRENELEYFPSMLKSSAGTVKNGECSAAPKKKRPIEMPEPLLGALWRTNEIAVCFASAGVGKSIFAAQAAESIARGVPFGPFIPPAARSVLHIDLGLSDGQFSARYTATNGTKYRFSSRYERLSINPRAEVPEIFAESFDEYLMRSIIRDISRSNARVVIIDNVEALIRSSGGGIRGYRRAINWAQRVSHAGIALLLVANSRDFKRPRPLSISDLGPAEPLAAGADSVFAIGASTWRDDARYVRQLKSRASAISFTEDAVAVFQVGKCVGPAAGTRVVSRSAKSRKHISKRDLALERELFHANICDPARAAKIAGLTPYREAADRPYISDEPFLGCTFLGCSTESILIDTSTTHLSHTQKILRAQQLHSLRTAKLLLP